MSNLTRKNNFRKNIDLFAKALANSPRASFGSDSNDVCPVTHSFSDGMYVREIFIPAGMWIVGRIHREDHPNFLLKGKVVVETEEGKVELTAPMSMISKAGTQRALYTLTDTVWVTVHLNPDNKQDVDRIVDRISVLTYEELSTGLKKLIVNIKNRFAKGKKRFNQHMKTLKGG